MSSLIEMLQALKDRDASQKVDFSKPLDASSVKDKTVLITGGASGLGEASARAFAKAGAYVTVADLNEELGSKLEKELVGLGQKVKFVKTDVLDWDSQTNAFKAAIAFSPANSLNIVIPCAGTTGGRISLAPPENPEADPPKPTAMGLRTLLFGEYYTTCLAMHYFSLPTAATDRSLLLVSSMAGYSGIPLAIEYTTAKHGVRGLFYSLRAPCKQAGIRVNLLAPTFIDTPMIAHMMEGLKKAGVKFATTEDCVDAVLRVSSDSTISGRAVCVGGDGNFDLRDDHDGKFGGEELEDYLKRGMLGIMM
ncbi:MAG: hypothetical protein M1834_004583 [Cirrosporium novae-zelandiae]|nr:MAG: hypothetical protein M1834_004583 [Cirrosporium novae-zelandiae]